jgi:NAD(P)H-dependent flavin oxidoreductase YrpB (nitropropane dioxygenase family)
MAASPGLVGAAIGVLCTAGPTRDIIARAIHARGAHPIVRNNAGQVTGTTMAFRAAALVVDMTDPACLSAVEAATSSGVPVVACAFSLPESSARARLKELGIDLVVGPDADTLGGALLRAIATRGR